MRKMLSYLAFVLAAMSVVVSPALAQTTAGVRGTITDPTSLVVPSAKVTISNVATRTTKTTTTGSEGMYSITLVPVGTYTLNVEAACFKAFAQSGIAMS